MLFKSWPALVLVSIICLSKSACAQQSVTVEPYMVTLNADAKIRPGAPITFDVYVMDWMSMAPSDRITVDARLTMPSMSGMKLEVPKVTKGGKLGHFHLAVSFPHAGDYKVEVRVRSEGGKVTELPFKFGVKEIGELAGYSVVSTHSMGGTSAMNGMQMKAALGGWTASREGSGTSWQPDSSPMFMKMLPSYGGFELSAMGTIQAGYVDPGSKRVSSQYFDNSMIMLMGQREVGKGTLGLHFMTSFDPIFNGERGVPNLFQTGETAHGVPLVDRQHPHNLYSEIAASYSHPISSSWSGFVYGGPVGEPALGDVMFMHRASGMEVPEAPISHHWFDSTHISFGVATVGLVYREKWKFEGSAFNGHEPGENRYVIEPVELNSGSGRVSYNPGKDWSLSGSYGYLSSPEAMNPGVNEHRLTYSVAYSHALASGDSVAVTTYLGQNFVEGTTRPSDGWLGEATYFHASEAVFVRLERVDKGELSDVPAGDYVVGKLLVGDVHNFYSKDQIEYGIGAYVGVYRYPGALDPYYGKHPLTVGVFVRLRPSKM